MKTIIVQARYTAGLYGGTRNFHTQTKITKWDGLLAQSTRSLNGYRPDQLKSWLQKSIRRGNQQHAMYAALELDTLGMAARTNMWNRLIKIAVEDIGIANRDAITRVMQEHKKWMSHRGTDTTRDQKGTQAICDAVALLCQSQKIRLVSDIKATYDNPPRDIVRDFPLLYLKINDDYKESSVVINPSKFIRETADWTADKYILPGDPPQLERLLQNLLGYMRCGNDRAFYWAYRILEVGKCARRDRRTGSEQVLWNVAMRLCHPDHMSNILALYDAYKSQTTETTMFVIQALLLFMRTSRTLDTEIKAVDAEKTWMSVLIDEPRKIPDYAIDIHTSEGRQSGATVADFASTGALVENEVKELVHPEMRRIYVANKNWIPLVAQLPTNASKKPVYIYNDVVVKGPFTDDTRLRDIHAKLTKLRSPIQPMTIEIHFGKYYVVWPQLATRPQADWVIGAPQKSPSGPRQIRVVDRDSMGIALARTAQLDDEKWFWIWVHLIHRLVLGIGDSHLNNIVVTNNGIYGIDFDEQRPPVEMPKTLNELEKLAWSMKPSRDKRQQGFAALVKQRERIKKHLTDNKCVLSANEELVLQACVKSLDVV